MGAGLHHPLCPPRYSRDQLWAQQQAHSIQGTQRAEGTAGVGGCQPAQQLQQWAELSCLSVKQMTVMSPDILSSQHCPGI